jgi:DNA invertase Pin-like site-specific DNA recombinase
MLSVVRDEPDDTGLTAIYCRISDDSTGEQAGVERQMKDCRTLTRAKGWPVVVFRDDDISASKYTRKRRPAYRDMLARVRTGEIRRIVCWHIDRLYRQPKELEELIDLADSGAVQIVSVCSGQLDLSNSDGIAMARVQVAFAAKASDDMSRRIKRQKAEQRERGFPSGSRPCFGWIDEMTPDPDQAALVGEAMRSILAGGSLSAICRSWNARGIRPRGSAKTWTGTRVRDVLANPRHAGLMTYHGEVVGDAAWPAIVDRETSERVRSVLAARGASYARSHGPRGGKTTLLTSLIRCGRCGNGMWRANTNGNSAWRCPAGPGRPGCGLSIVAEPLEAKVTTAVFQIVDNVGLARLVADHGGDDDHSSTVIALGVVERRIDELAELYAVGEVDDRFAAAANRRLRAEAEGLRSRLARADRAHALLPYAGRPGALRDAWDGLSPEERRACVADAVIAVTIGPGRGGPRFDSTRVTIGSRFDEPQAATNEP